MKPIKDPMEQPLNYQEYGWGVFKGGSNWENTRETETARKAGGFGRLVYIAAGFRIILVEAED